MRLPVACCCSCRLLGRVNYRLRFSNPSQLQQLRATCSNGNGNLQLESATASSTVVVAGKDAAIRTWTWTWTRTWKLNVGKLQALWKWDRAAVAATGAAQNWQFTQQVDVIRMPRDREREGEMNKVEEGEGERPGGCATHAACTVFFMARGNWRCMWSISSACSARLRRHFSWPSIPSNSSPSSPSLLLPPTPYKFLLLFRELLQRSNSMGIKMFVLCMRSSNNNAGITTTTGTATTTTTRRIKAATQQQ